MFWSWRSCKWLGREWIESSPPPVCITALWIVNCESVIKIAKNEWEKSEFIEQIMAARVFSLNVVFSNNKIKPSNLHLIHKERKERNENQIRKSSSLREKEIYSLRNCLRYNYVTTQGRERRTVINLYQNMTRYAIYWIDLIIIIVVSHEKRRGEEVSVVNQSEVWRGRMARLVRGWTGALGGNIHFFLCI